MWLHCARSKELFICFPIFRINVPLCASRGAGRGLCDLWLEKVHEVVLPGFDFYLEATELGVRGAGVDYDGSAALATWSGFQRMTEGAGGRHVPAADKRM
jgi:hypothetical protein